MTVLDHFRRAVRVHPRRGVPAGWGPLEPVPWLPTGFFHGDSIDPGTRLDYHTGTCYPQDAASQVPVLLLDPRPGEIVVDACAAPGSKTSQIGLALGDTGLVVAGDPSPQRRAVLVENLARQGVACGLVTPMPLERLAERHPGAADAVLVDAPCSGHAIKSPRQHARMGERQLAILVLAAALVRPGGRLVYSTCTAALEEDEGVVTAFLAGHPEWSVVPRSLPGCGVDRAGLGAIRLSPEDQGTEPFFACLLIRAGHAPAEGFSGILPPSVEATGQVPPWREAVPLAHVWQRGNAVLLGSALAASAALPADARGLLIGHGDKLDPWGVQGLIERGAAATRISRPDALALWAGEERDLPPGALLATDTGAPLGAADPAGRRLHLPSRLRRSGLL